MASEASIALGASPSDDRQRLRAIRLTAMASLIGTTIEWYDFILYTSLAGLIFNKLYLPGRRSGGVAAAGLRDVRRRLPHPPDRRRVLRSFRRPHRPQAVAGADPDDDGRGDVPDRPGADLCRDRHSRADHDGDAAAHPGFRHGRRMGRRGADGIRIRPARTSRLLRQLPADRLRDRTVPQHRRDHAAVVAAVERGVRRLGLALRLLSSASCCSRSGCSCA